MLGKWKSKTTGLVVDVVKITEDLVFWEDKNWTFTQATEKQAFLDSMQKAED